MRPARYLYQVPQTIQWRFLMPTSPVQKRNQQNMPPSNMEKSPQRIYLGDKKPGSIFCWNTDPLSSRPNKPSSGQKNGKRFVLANVDSCDRETVGLSGRNAVRQFTIQPHQPQKLLQQIEQSGGVQEWEQRVIVAWTVQFGHLTFRNRSDRRVYVLQLFYIG